MKHKMILGCLSIALLLMTSFFIADDAQADALLFPWIIKSDTISTMISVVNTAGNEVAGYQEDPPYVLHYQYWYKHSVENTDTEYCESFSFMRATSANDIVTFDAARTMENGMALFNDSSPYGEVGFGLTVEAPRRGFLIVDNNTPGFTLADENKDGTLYGEALMIDHSNGTLFGYTAYNARLLGNADTASAPVLFIDKFDYQGEVIGPSEAGRTVLLPPDEYNTKFYITPIGLSNQRDGMINTSVELASYKINDELHGGIFDNDENPFDMQRRVNVVCTAGIDLEDMMTQAVYLTFRASGEQGWAYVKTDDGTEDATQSNQAAIGKLEWNTFTKTFKVDLSDSEECVSCKEECFEDCSTKPGKRPNFICNARCAKLCKKFCYIEKSLTTFPGNFQWIRSGDSLPLPEFN